MRFAVCVAWLVLGKMREGTGKEPHWLLYTVNVDDGTTHSNCTQATRRLKAVVEVGSRSAPLRWARGG